MSCLIIGDSIAVGIAGALGALHPHDCDVRATVGASVEAVSAMLPQRRYRSVIVAVGSNDSTRELRVRLPDLRARLGGARVTWIYPYGRSVAWEISAVARLNGDRAFGFWNVGSSAYVHPADSRAGIISGEDTSELQSHLHSSNAVFCLQQTSCQQTDN